MVLRIVDLSDAPFGPFWDAFLVKALWHDRQVRDASLQDLKARGVVLKADMFALTDGWRIPPI